MCWSPVLRFFVGSLMVLAGWHAAVAATAYRGPQAVVATKDGKTVLVANLDAKQIAVVDTAAAKIVKTIDVPEAPEALALSPDEATLYVACAAPKSTVCAIDLAAGKIKSKLPAGHTASGLAVGNKNQRLYVCNRFNNNVAVFDLAKQQQIACVPAVREPVGAAITPDDKTVFVINLLPADRATAYDVAAAVTVIDTATNQASTIRLINGSTGVHGLAISPDGKYVYVTHLLSRYQMPTTQLERGWMNTNALSIIDAAEKKLVNTVLLDSVDLGAANPWGVCTTPDGKTLCVAHAGTHELSLIDAEGLMKKLSGIPVARPEKSAGTAYSPSASQTQADVPNDLAFLVDLRRRIALPGQGARGVAVAGGAVYISEYFSDTLAKVTLAERPEISAIAVGPKPVLTAQRRGEMLFYDATMCFQHWQSCASCHPDARVDGLNWDLMNDGLGNPKNTKSMLLTHQTPPAMSEAVRMSAEEAVRSGIKHILFAVRPEEEACAIDDYLKSLKPVPSPHLVDGHLSPAAERGKKLFHDPDLGCARCHPAPLYTDLNMHDVASRGQFDRRETFDCPTLIEVWRTAPYLHDGRYATLKELFFQGKHDAKAGSLNKLKPEQIDDLIEFVLSL